MRHNLGEGQVRTIDFKTQQTYLKSFPKIIREFLMNEAISSLDVRNIYNMYRQCGKDLTMTLLLYHRSKETYELYGPDHPNSDFYIKHHQELEG